MVEPARTNLGNRYELGGLLATGGMGQVWRAQDLLLGRPVAVKVLRSEYTGDPLFRARFRAEAHHAAALSHPNIAAVYDYGEETALDGSGECLAYLVMELVEGESLSSLLDRTGALTPAATLDVLRQTASALGAAHAAGVVHRDVKPGNVLVCEDGTVKITDFGIAWSAGSVPLTQTGQVIGTAAYLSPEAASGSHATPASDVYSLGMVGYECLAGHKAFDGENSVAIAIRQLRDQPEPLPPEVPAGVRSLIEHCLVKDPARRIPDGNAFVAAVDDVVAGAVMPPVAPTDTVSLWLVPGGVPVSGATAAGSTGTSPAVAAVAPAPTPIRRRVGRALVPVAALLLGAGIAGTVVQQLAPTGGNGATAEAAAVAAQPSTSSGEPIVPLAPGGYTGRPLDQVRAELEALGLLVQTEGVVTAELTPSLVLDLTPGDGEVRRGDLVLLRYAVAPEESSPEPRRPEPAPVDTVVDEPVETTAPPSTTVPPPAPEPTATPTDAGTPSSSGPTTTEPTGDAGEDGEDGTGAGTGAGTTAPEETDGGDGDADGGESSSGDEGNGSDGGSSGRGDGNGSGETGGSKGRGAGADR